MPKMIFKKETKGTVVYTVAAADEGKVAVESVYVEKGWLRTQTVGGNAAWPQSIEVEVKLS